jgi:hypothetical protein
VHPFYLTSYNARRIQDNWKANTPKKFTGNKIKSNKLFSISKLKFPSCFDHLQQMQLYFSRNVIAINKWKWSVLGKYGGISADDLEFCRQFAGYHVY